MQKQYFLINKKYNYNILNIIYYLFYNLIKIILFIARYLF